MNLPFDVGISPTLHIRGLIANRDIKKGEVVERAPVVLISKKEEEHLKKTVLWKYYYEWSNKHHVIVLGYGSLYNHSYEPNIRYGFNFKWKVLVYKAIKPIKKGEELMVNYNWDPDNKDPVDDFLMDFNAHMKG